MEKELRTEFSQRQYMLSEDFEIYYYKDIKLKPVKEHIHDYYEFYFFLEGEVDIHIKNKSYTLKHGDVILIPPKTKHYPIIKNLDIPYRRFVLWISKNYCCKLKNDSEDYMYMIDKTGSAQQYIYHNDSIDFNSIQSMIFQLIEEVKGNRFAKQAKIQLQINTLILFLSRLIYEKENTIENGEKKLYLRVCEYIDANIDSDLSLERISEEFYVSKYYISHNFTDNMGISIYKYITKKRLNACKNAFLSRMSIAEACNYYGFDDYSAFYRAFKKEYGMSPKQYRDIFFSK